MHIFQNFTGGDTPNSLLVLWPRTEPLHSKILAAHLWLASFNLVAKILKNDKQNQTFPLD